MKMEIPARMWILPKICSSLDIFKWIFKKYGVIEIGASNETWDHRNGATTKKTKRTNVDSVRTACGGIALCGRWSDQYRISAGNENGTAI